MKMRGNITTKSTIHNPHVLSPDRSKHLEIDDDQWSTNDLLLAKNVALDDCLKICFGYHIIPKMNRNQTLGNLTHVTLPSQYSKKLPPQSRTCFISHNFLCWILTLSITSSISIPLFPSSTPSLLPTFRTPNSHSSLSSYNHQSFHNPQSK